MPISSATEILGSPIPKAKISQAESGGWRVIFVVDESSGQPILVILSIQKSTPDDPAKFVDVFNSVITEVSSTRSEIDPNLFGEFVTAPIFTPEDEKNKKPS